MQGGAGYYVYNSWNDFVNNANPRAFAITYGNNENSKKNDENVEVVYYLNGEKTDKDNYEKTVKEHTSGKYYILGQDNDITEDTIKALAEGKYKEAEKK